MGMQIIETNMENIMEISYKIQNTATNMIQPAIPLLEIYSKEMK